MSSLQYERIENHLKVKNRTLHMKRAEIVSYLKNLRNQIITEFESLEPACRFERKSWSYSRGDGGGETSVLRGDIFEKAAVNWSGVSGQNFPGQTEPSPFFATGLSLITHMANPKAPTAHFNIRYIEKTDEKTDG